MLSTTRKDRSQGEEDVMSDEHAHTLTVQKSAADSRHIPENSLPHPDSTNWNEAGLSLLQTSSRLSSKLSLSLWHLRRFKTFD